MNIELTYGYDAEMLRAKLDEVAEEFNQDAIDSTVVRQNGRFVVSPEQTGLEMEKDKTAKHVAKVRKHAKAAQRKLRQR